ncbi:unnamed protein product, partial [Amoebophrya sp. A25]|eukprot:GSA25T00021044001.1
MPPAFDILRSTSFAFQEALDVLQPGDAKSSRFIEGESWVPSHANGAAAALRGKLADARALMRDEGQAEVAYERVEDRAENIAAGRDGSNPSGVLNTAQLDPRSVTVLPPGEVSSITPMLEEKCNIRRLVAGNTAKRFKHLGYKQGLRGGREIWAFRPKEGLPAEENLMSNPSFWARGRLIHEEDCGNATSGCIGVRWRDGWNRNFFTTPRWILDPMTERNRTFFGTPDEAASSSGDNLHSASLYNSKDYDPRTFVQLEDGMAGREAQNLADLQEHLRAFMGETKLKQLMHDPADAIDGAEKGAEAPQSPVGEWGKKAKADAAASGEAPHVKEI